MNNCGYDIISTIHEEVKFKGPFLEIGSKIYNKKYQFRNVFRSCAYCGVDMAEGDGVDIIEDIHTYKSCPTFNSVLCFTMLEHDSDIDATLKTVQLVLKGGGKALFVTPFYYHIHGYPDDYQRLTPNGMRNYLSRYFTDVQTFGVGPELIPHHVIGIVNGRVSYDTINHFNKKWPHDNGKIYYYAQQLLPPVVIKAIKWLMYGRFY